MAFDSSSPPPTRPDPALPPPGPKVPRSRTGTWLVLGLVIVGAAIAVLAEHYRDYGPAPGPATRPATTRTTG